MQADCAARTVQRQGQRTRTLRPQSLFSLHPRNHGVLLLAPPCTAVECRRHARPALREYKSVADRRGMDTSVDPPAPKRAKRFELESTEAVFGCKLKGSIDCLAATANMRWLFAAGSDGTVYKYDFWRSMNGGDKGILLTRWTTKAAEGTSSGLNNDGGSGIVAATSLPPSGPSLASPSTPGIHCLAAHSEGVWLLSGNSSGQLQIWGVRTTQEGTCAHTSDVHRVCLYYHLEAASLLFPASPADFVGIALFSLFSSQNNAISCRCVNAAWSLFANLLPLLCTHMFAALSRSNPFGPSGSLIAFHVPGRQSVVADVCVLPGEQACISASWDRTVVRTDLNTGDTMTFE